MPWIITSILIIAVFNILFISSALADDVRGSPSRNGDFYNFFDNPDLVYLSDDDRARARALHEQDYSYFERIDDLGGVLPAIETGFFQGEISDSAYRYQREIDQQIRHVIGVNAFLDEKDPEKYILEI